MAKRYAIADFLPLEARRVAVEAEYHDGRTSDGYCPLGLVLRELQAAGLIEQRPYAASPGCGAVADAVLQARQSWSSLETAAFDFTVAWDSGEIADLAAALGVD